MTEPTPNPERTVFDDVAAAIAAFFADTDTPEDAAYAVLAVPALVRALAIQAAVDAEPHFTAVETVQSYDESRGHNELLHRLRAVSQ